MMLKVIRSLALLIIISINSNNSYAACSVYLPKNIENCLVTLEKAAKNSEYIPHGTGFLFSYIDTGDRFVITNRHVLTDKDSLFVRINVIDENKQIKGGRWIVRLKDEGKDTWSAHPDSNIDLAVFPFLGKIPIYPIGSDRVKSFQNVNLGDPVLFLGFPLLPAALGDINYPLVRSGIISFKTQADIMKPFTDTVLVYSNHIIIDGVVMSGNSGSPVFSCPNKNSEKITLIGVISSHLFRFTEIDMLDSLTTRAQYEKDYDLGICIPSEYIIDTIEEFYKTNIRFRKE